MFDPRRVAIVWTHLEPIFRLFSLYPWGITKRQSTWPA